MCLIIYYGIIFSLMICFGRRTYATPIDNNVLGDPKIECSADFLNVEFSTRNPFSGKLYVKGQYANLQCVVDKSQARDELRLVTVKVVFGTCNVERRRSVNPKGVFIRATVVIQFHPNFVTKVDKAYQINCFYQEASKTVSSSLEVSMINTDIITNTYAMPICTYSIRKETVSGMTVRYAKVGDPVMHRWECHSTSGPDKDSAYGMLVHSCYVNDGSGNNELVIDDKGCGLDPYILGHLTYTDDILTAYREAHVFKFADQNIVYFSCQIRLCMKTMDACRGMTPPKCLNLKNKRHLLTKNEMPIVLNNSSLNFDEDDNLLDVQSNSVIVFDSEEDSYIPLQKTDDKEEQPFVCLTVQTTIVLCSAIGVLILAIGISITFFVMKYRQYSQRSMENLLTKSS